MADTRKNDLMELIEARKGAKSMAERDQFDQIIDKIAREGGETRQERERLIMAIRNNDRRATRYFNDRLARISQNQTYGRSIS